MKKLLQTIAIIAILTGVQNIAGAYNTNRFINMNHLAYNYNYKKLLAYSNNPIDNVFITPEISQDLSVAKVIDDDFSLEMDLDVNSKKQIKPKANIIPNEKRENSSKCVEKVMKPHLDKYKVNTEIIEEDVANLDIDKVTDVKDMVKKQKQEKKQKIAKTKTEPRERVGWFSFLKRDKSKTDTVAVRNENLPEIDDIDNVSEAAVSNVETERFKKNANKTEEKTVVSKTEEKPVKVVKVAEPKPEKIKPVKAEKEKPVKVAKVKEEKVVTPKPEKVKPIKVAKVKEEKVITPKAEKVKPVKIAKVEEPKPEKVKPVKVEKEKPMKVAKVEEPKQKKTEIKEEKTTFASKPVIARTEENDLFNIDDVNSNIEGKTKHKVNKEKPVKVVKVIEPKPEKVKPIKVAKVKEEKVITPKAEKEKPVKIAKVEEPKREKVKPVKIAKEKPIKVAKFKENSVSVKPQTNNLTINSAIFNTKPAMNNQSQLSILSSNANIFGSVAQKPVTQGVNKAGVNDKIASVKAEPKQEKVKPVKEKPAKVAKVKDEKFKPMKVAKAEEPKSIKVAKENPVKVAKVKEEPVETSKVKKEEVKKAASVKSEPKTKKVAIKSEQVIKKPAEVKNTFTPASNKVAVKPAEVKNTFTPASNKVAVKPAEVKNTFTPKEQIVEEPVEVKPILTPIPEKEPVLTKQDEIKTAFAKKPKQVVTTKDVKPAYYPPTEPEKIEISPEEIKTAFTNKTEKIASKPVIAKTEENDLFNIDDVNSSVEGKTKPQKPAKIVKVKEEKVVTPKSEKIKPVKVAKVKEQKQEKVKPVKIAKVEEPKPEKIKLVKAVKEKPVKVAKVKEEKQEKIAEVKTTSVKSKQIEKQPVNNTSVPTPAATGQIAMRPKADAPVLTSKPKQVEENAEQMKNTYTPISDEQLAEELEEVEEYTPKNEPEQTFVPLTADEDLFSIDEFDSKVKGKVRPRRPVKVAKIKEESVINRLASIKERTKSQKPVKVKEPKPVKVAEVKEEPVSISQTGVNNSLINNAVFRTATSSAKQTPLSIMSISVSPTGVNKGVNKGVNRTATPAYKQVAKVHEDNKVNVENRVFTPIKVEPKQVAARTEVKNTVTPVTKPVVVNKITPAPELQQKEVKPVEVRDTYTPAPVSNQVVTKQVEVNTFTPTSAANQDTTKHIDVNTFTPPIYKASIPQETPVYNAFETMQNRLPITRKSFDDEI